MAWCPAPPPFPRSVIQGIHPESALHVGTAMARPQEPNPTTTNLSVSGYFFVLGEKNLHFQHRLELELKANVISIYDSERSIRIRGWNSLNFVIRIWRSLCDLIFFSCSIFVGVGSDAAVSDGWTDAWKGYQFALCNGGLSRRECRCALVPPRGE